MVCYMSHGSSALYQTVTVVVFIVMCKWNLGWLVGWLVFIIPFNTRSFPGQFLQAISPNQQCQSTEGNQSVVEIRLEFHQNHSTLLWIYGNTTLVNRFYARHKGPNVTNPICWTCKNSSYKCTADCAHYRVHIKRYRIAKCDANWPPCDSKCHVLHLCAIQKNRSCLTKTLNITPDGTGLKMQSAIRPF